MQALRCHPVACEAPSMARSLTWGCCPWCLTEEEKTAARIDQEINKILLEQKKQERGELKLLLLGECGVQRRGPERAGSAPSEAAGARLSLADPFSRWGEKASRSWVSHSWLSCASGCGEVALAGAATQTHPYVSQEGNEGEHPFRLAQGGPEPLPPTA